MLNQLLDNIIAAPIRVILLILGFLVLHQIFTKQNKSNYNYRFFLNRIAIYGAVVLIMMFVLIQLDMYHIFSLLLFLLLIGCFSYFNLKDFITYTKSGGRFRRATLIAFFSFVEKEPITFSKNVKKSLQILRPKKINYSLLLVLLISFLAVLARILLIENDEYTFSNIWLKKLAIVKNFDANQWYVRGQNLVPGELAIMNLYATLTGISKEMAIFTFGLFETFLVAALVFYITNVLVQSKYIAPIVAALTFAFFLAFLPVNVNALYQHSSIYIGFIFSIPLMIFVLVPSEFNLQSLSYFKVQFVLSLAIAFSDFYVMFILLPVFFFVAFVTKPKQSSVKKTFYAYLIAGVFILVLRAITCYVSDREFLKYFLDNIIVIESYSYIPQLLLPESQLKIIYMVLGITSLFASILLISVFKDKNQAAFRFTLFYLLFVFINALNTMWLDKDLFNQTLTILVPILIGVNVGLYYKIIKLLSKSYISISKVFGISVVVLSLCLSYYSYSHSLKVQDFKNIEKLKIDLLKVYDQLSTYQMRNTYAVVNKAYGLRLSGNEHMFINHEDFIGSYLERDSIYKKIKNNKKLLLENSEFILPNSVFVFVTDTTIVTPKDEFLKTPGNTAIALEAVVNTLKQRGNVVNTYFQSKNLKVYEIVNVKNGSNLNEMIFNYESNN